MAWIEPCACLAKSLSLAMLAAAGRYELPAPCAAPAFVCGIGEGWLRGPAYQGGCNCWGRAQEPAGPRGVTAGGLRDEPA